MIIECPKCKTKFEVSDVVLNDEMKFQCSECAYIWNEHIEKNKTENAVKDNDDGEKLPAILTEEQDENEVVKKVKKNQIFSMKNLLIFTMVVILFVIIIGLAQSVLNDSKISDGQGVFGADAKGKNSKNLYIEIVKPLTLTKEGVNEYIIIRGFIYNPTDEVKRIPKLVIRLENKEGRILQEQEREINVTELAPLEKTDFMFKVKFLSQVTSVRVDFIDETKI